MALPHYKLHPFDKSLTLQAGSFPIILVPADPPQRVERLRNGLRSKKLLSTFALLAVCCSAALLWLLLDPSGKVPNPRYLFVLAGMSGSCVLVLLLAAFLGRSAAAEAPALTEPEIVAVERKETVKALPRRLHVEAHCEEWSSEPFLEILDESILAEIFDDKLAAPDRLVFCLQVED